ncbi:hypothetical protein P167DRAFT_579435 [Morchella conica CCBAS932]|uniref:Uncharacterized protein n=1 Tax=Morchella conica CCBAS932 TaxID=1392247 RepID=A0A3N4KN95_9PEZI|nr:hypothetical protein P167DRAFT_579435 [Morchella conica CCBAS932]
MTTVTLNKSDIIAIAIGCTTICVNALGLVEAANMGINEITPGAVGNRVEISPLPVLVIENVGIDAAISADEDNNSNNDIGIPFSSSMEPSSPPPSPPL